MAFNCRMRSLAYKIGRKLVIPVGADKAVAMAVKGADQLEHRTVETRNRLTLQP
jgi:hypothetical protein